MANRYLAPLYRKLYGCDFSYFDCNKRMKMQKAIYLLQDMGVPVGNYAFKWCRRGLYSQELKNDMFYENGRNEYKLSLSEENAESVALLHSVIHNPNRSEYTIGQWVELVASLHYLRKNILRYNADTDDVVTELEQRIPHLNKHDVNLLAYEIVENLFE